MYQLDCEASEHLVSLSKKIVEYNVSYVYHALFAYFDRESVALKGLAKCFKESSLEEREHAEKLMEYQNKRDGKVKLQSMLMPLTEFDHVKKGDALYGKYHDTYLSSPYSYNVLTKLPNGFALLKLY
ncbi:hypothetical protein Dsin_021354 [Dipteronia sinensis]|uniref:Ferritin n=1 Tax=Dipteronia sinensis TaxID=43782 RepID=A0AAE0A019_9ROSI|nr:hypothetical protein Dsin_021354 [Dipteronia sinensis]